MSEDDVLIRNEFLKDIRDNPDDDVVRLIYADWLEDKCSHNKDDLELASFIRNQISGNKSITTIPKCCLNEKVIVDFIGITKWKFGTVGTTEDGGLSWTLGDNEVVWKRGFVHTIWCSPEVWVNHRVKLVRNHPIQHVRLLGLHPSLGSPEVVKILQGKWRWTIFDSTQYGDTRGTYHLPYMLFTTWVGDLNDVVLTDGLWTLHDNATAAFDWLSDRLISYANEISKSHSDEQRR